MNRTTRADNVLAQLDGLNEHQLRRLLVEHLTKQKLGLYWEANAIERDAALNANIVLPWWKLGAACLRYRPGITSLPAMLSLGA